MDFQKCALCEDKDATKTNSHIIPSFLIAPICSYDGSGKRDKEVMFTMTPYEEKIYTGQIPDTKIQELFNQDELSDDRIENELKNNTAAKDYIFCPCCEKRLSDYLETPYASCIKDNRKITADVQYMFWLSVVWRLSVSEQFNFRLPIDIENAIRKDLFDFIIAKESGNNVSDIVSRCTFVYRIVKRKNKNIKLGYIGGLYNYDMNILSYTVGDLILIASFSKDIPEQYKYYGFEEYIIKAPINDGTILENQSEIDDATYDALIHKFIKSTALKKLFAESEKADACWKSVGLPGKMPETIKKALIEKLYAEDVKQGDRHSKERYIHVFNEILQSFGYKPK